MSVIHFKQRLILLAALALLPGAALAITYMTAEDFVASSFDEAPSPAVLWLSREHQAVASEVLGHRYGALRLRYWLDGERSAWILDETGKERPITIGVVIEAGEIRRVAILAYRETRGGEVRHPFFTSQFVGLTLSGDRKLTGPIDGITGATLSVRAVTNIGRFALYLDQAARGTVRAQR